MIFSLITLYLAMHIVSSILLVIKEKFPFKYKILTKLQACIRSFLVRKKVNKNIFNKTSRYKLKESDFQNILKSYSAVYQNLEIKSFVNNEDRSFYIGEIITKKKDDKLLIKKHGRGIQEWIDGSRYFGYFVEDKQSIKGKLIHPDGSYYDGEFFEGKANGKGVYRFPDGTIYDGMWKNDLQDGIGKEIWPDGSIFEGYYSKGYKCGKGKFLGFNGSSYDGNYKENKFNGTGIYIWPDKRQYIGNWKDNKMDGDGCFIWPDKRKYQGEFKDDKKHGYGIYEWSDGVIYRGFWKEGKQHGEGEILEKNEINWKKGTWNEGKFKGWK